MRRTTILALIISVLALAAAGWVVWAQVATTTDKAAVEEQAQSLADRVAEACAKGGQAAAELGRACQQAAEVKPGPDTAAPAPTVDPATVRQAARAAVLDYCGQPSAPCRGPDGSTPNVDAIVAQVLTRIPVPKDGTDGKDGDDAPPLSDDQVFAQVAAFCSQPSEPCRGPAGANGTNGVDGKDGPTCPEGYELGDALITAPNGSTYQGKACIDPGTSQPPTEPTPPAKPTR
ncbi:hypothetical protein [Amycolatopsis thermophila]|uniref:Uncharacterized protein n=1 Tax=Amycolatopsis thermophila TaxID=206084 RepID=A0ABU0ERM5_9PSEU|nr:hypothetical protein [Amycolatopsis thermophila]MDQ0377955.1 hypothetical protein [Amycolatopsis thermophila]